MTKLNYGYLSPILLARMLLKHANKDVYWDSRRFEFREGKLKAEEYYLRKGIKINTPLLLFLAPLQPFVDAGKDFADTFKPYECWDDFFQDLKQPLYGIANFLMGVATFIFCGLALPLALIGCLLSMMTAGIFLLEGKSTLARETMEGCGLVLGGCVSWLMESLALINRGITQIAATPLTYFLKMPLRGLLYAFSDSPYAEDKPESQRLALLGHELLDNPTDKNLSTAYRIKEMLEMKMDRAKIKGKKIRSKDLEAQEDNPQNARDYFERFYSRSNANFSLFAMCQSIWAQKSPDRRLVSDGNYSLMKELLLYTFGFYSRIKQPDIDKFQDQNKRLENSKSESQKNTI